MTSAFGLCRDRRTSLATSKFGSMIIPLSVLPELPEYFPTSADSQAFLSPEPCRVLNPSSTQTNFTCLVVGQLIGPLLVACNRKKVSSKQHGRARSNNNTLPSANRSARAAAAKRSTEWHCKWVDSLSPAQRNDASKRIIPGMLRSARPVLMQLRRQRAAAAATTPPILN